MPKPSCFELLLLGFILLITPVYSKFAFTALNETASDADKSSVSLFFFGVHSPVAKYLPTSKMLLNCEYDVLPHREVDRIGIVKYLRENSSAIHYNYICGRDSNNSLYEAYNNSVDIDASPRIRVVYPDSDTMNGSKCENVPRNRGSVIFQLDYITDDDIGAFRCQVHLREVSAQQNSTDISNSDDYLLSREVRNRNCPADKTTECTDIDPVTILKCPLRCEFGRCEVFGVAWICVCAPGYRLTDHHTNCEYIPEMSSYLP